jgi:hypothetical protein
MPSSEQIRESIEARLGELRSEMTSLEAARAALQTNGGSAVRSKPAGAAGTSRKATRRRSSTSASEATAAAAQAGPGTAPAANAPVPATSEPTTKPVSASRKRRGPVESKAATRRKLVEVLLAGKLEAMLREAENGLNAVAIAKQASARDTQVRDLLRELESAGRVRRTGTGRASRWRLVTDDERIAERAAEIAALSSSKR